MDELRSVGVSALAAIVALFVSIYLLGIPSSFPVFLARSFAITVITIGAVAKISSEV